MQISLFDGSNKYKIDKPIRLIELFAGYGSQHFALEYLGLKFESWKICEWAVKSIQAYKDAHFNHDNIDYSKDHSKEFIFNRLSKWGISNNYNEPMTKDQIKRLGEEKARKIYNNIKATHNLVNIQQVCGDDLKIVDTDKYCYLMTYSFPCQDLSSAGLGKGMGKGSGTRSGMLWEVERILDELKTNNKELPQVLLMENVPEVIGTKNIKHFAKWLEKLESLGYKCYWKVLNAKDYGIPQNRERCFMISILGDYYYDFPEQQKLGLRLKDLLEDEVDEKYYLSDKAIKGSLNTTFSSSKLESVIPNQQGIMPALCARDYKDPKCIIESDNNNNTININGKEYPITKNNENLKKQLCNKLIENNMVEEGDVVRHSYSNSRMNKFYASNKENKECSPTLDTRCDCLGIVVKDDLKYVDRKLLETIANNNGIVPEFADLYNARPINNGIAGTLSTSCGNDCGCGSFAYINNLRIRKLTPKEYFRLMGVKDKDFEKIAENQSNASLYHLAGDSIVVDVIMAIFKQMT